LALRSLVIAYGERLDLSGHRLSRAFKSIVLALALQLDPTQQQPPLFKRNERVRPDAVAMGVPWFQPAEGAPASERYAGAQNDCHLNRNEE